jgi:hypothetical protein
MTRGIGVFTLLCASVAWLIPWPNLLILSAAVWLAVWFWTLPKPSTSPVKRRSERGS